MAGVDHVADSVNQLFSLFGILHEDFQPNLRPGLDAILAPPEDLRVPPLPAHSLNIAQGKNLDA